MKLRLLPLALLTLLTAACSRSADGVIYRSDEFTVYNDSVVQGPYCARALSDRCIVSNYRSSQSSASQTVNNTIRFRLSLNSRDNELPPSHEHVASIAPGDTTCLIFGQRELISPNRTPQLLPHNTWWRLAVDMRPVLRAFDRSGYYVAQQGDTVFQEDFKGLYIAGDIEPLTWDFENLYSKDDRKFRPRSDSIFTLDLRINPPIPAHPDKTRWEISQQRKDSLLSRLPGYSSPQHLVDALYLMALDEIDLNTVREGDLKGTFRTGAEWQGVWTRDISYSAILSLALLDPQTCMNSLRAKVRNSRIVQDTGTGGAWPVSSDRVVWGIAAYEIYLVTGDTQWLQEARNVMKLTLDDDLATIYDSRFSLMHGEQSYLDWREQSYPRWMQPADIYSSMCLGTNAVYARVLDLYGLYDVAQKIKCAINDRLWIPDKGHYGQYLYCGFYPILSESCDNLGQSLAILFDIATPEMAQQIISNTPVLPFGTSSLYPQLPDIKPYHNDAVWPFVQAFWNLAAAKTLNEKAVKAGLAAIWRPAALFCTNKELFVASNGDFRGTAVNSDAQLWSCAGNAAMVLRLLCGISLSESGLSLSPFIPSTLPGKKSLTGLRYRNSTLDISVSGTGYKIKSFKLDGQYVNTDYVIPTSITGHHTIELELDSQPLEPSSINRQPQKWMPRTPQTHLNGSALEIENFDPSLDYKLFVNGVFSQDFSQPSLSLPPAESFTTYAIVPEAKDGTQGFSMRPLEYTPQGQTSFVTLDTLTTLNSPQINFSVQAPEAGNYFIDVRYGNGAGPINTDSKCAIRSLCLNSQILGPVVMPQRGLGQWKSSGWSNALIVPLHQGTNQLQLRFLTPIDVNMDGKINSAFIKQIRIIKI